MKSHESIVSYQIQIKKKLRTLQSPRKARDSLRVFEIWTSPAYIVVQWEPICSLTGLCCSQERSKSRKLGGCGALVVFTGELWVFLKAEKCAPRVGKRRRTRRIPKTYFCETARFCWDFSENMCEWILKYRPQRGYRERRADIFAWGRKVYTCIHTVNIHMYRFQVRCRREPWTGPYQLHELYPATKPSYNRKSIKK